jgi:MFS family permease
MSATAKKAAPSISAWAPFEQRAFTLLWTATLVSNVGTWMNDVGAGWLMTTLNSSPAVVSLVQAATTLPIFLFALFAGTLADRLDKRRLLISVNCLLCLAAFLLAWLVANEAMTPTLLIVFTFVMGTGAAFMAPAWQAVVPELVPREQLSPAIALNSMGINISRAIGPALAGFLITAVGLASPFLLNAVTHVLIILVLFMWRPPEATPGRLPPEPLLPAIVTGIRHATHNTPFKATLLRALSFFLFASAYWALLPLVARQLPGEGASLYGLLMGAVGVGAVTGALLLPKLKRILDTNQSATLGVVVTSLAMAMMGLAQVSALALFASLLAGLGWITVLTNLHVSAQTALPGWVRARGMSIFLMVFFGAMAAGSVLWGQLAQHTSITAALVMASVGAMLALAVTRSIRLGQAEDIDLTPSYHWSAPTVYGDTEDHFGRGPVMISITYRIAPEDESGFLSALRELACERYRDGAFQWNVFQQSEDPELWIEAFQVSSWAEHLRQHDRVTEHDRRLQEQVQQFHRGEDPPRVEHWLAPAISAGNEEIGDTP